MIKAIIFDCFGVFVGNPYKERVAWLDQHDPQLATTIRDINQATDRGYLSREESLEQMAKLLHMTSEQLKDEQDKGEVLNEQLVSFAKTLKGQYPLGLLSNVSGRDWLEVKFQPNKLEDLFNVVVASGDEGVIKPEPEIYRITAERLGLDPSECVMIDDIREFCDGAEAVGMHAIQFLSTDQCIRDITLLFDRGEKRE